MVQYTGLEEPPLEMTDTQLVAIFFGQVAFILIVCRAVGLFARRAGQPQVVAEMVAGFLIGPSFFGWIAPHLQATIFPTATLRPLFIVSQLGLVLYMFCVGLEFRPELMFRHARRAAAVSIAGIAAPFVLGGGLAILMFRHGGFFTDQVTIVQAVMFVGAAMSITAFPMLARIIYDRGIAGTSLGTLALAAGAIDDAAAWIILAVVVGSFTSDAWLAAVAAAGGVLYVFAVFAGRPLMAKLEATADAAGGVPPWMFSIVLAALAAGAWFTDLVGIYSVFGAFILGAAIPRGVLTRELQRLIEPLTTSLLVPLFFVYAGLNTRLGLVSSVWLWVITVLVFAAACAGKALACFVAARIAGATTRESMGVATLMNARGLMELILLNIGLQRGLITPTLFTVFVMMTIGTTLMAGPAFSFVIGREPMRELDPDYRFGESS
jgi:Kef-type K+ transport system membrane component KefB